MTFGELTNYVLEMQGNIPDEAEVGIEIGFQLDNGKIVPVLIHPDSVAYRETGKYKGCVVMCMNDEP